MNFLIVGNSVVDKIREKNKTIIKPGGIYYSAASLITQIKPSDKLFLLSAIDKKNKHLFDDIYSRVEQKYLNIVDSIPEVELTINTENERKEIYSHLGSNLNLHLDNPNQFSGILINMITGFDISLQQLKEIRKNYHGLIYFDVHTLSRGVDEKLRRTCRRIENFNQWAECIDILQVNESELQTLSDENDETKIIEEIFGYNVQQILITRAEKGASVYFREKNAIKKYDVNALRVEVINKVGCGDVFGAVYFYNYIQNKNILSALEKANLFAGVSTTYSQINEFRNLNKDAAKQSGKE